VTQVADQALSALERSRRTVLPEILSRNARRYPDKTALVFEDQARSFAALDERSNRLAGALAERGVTRGGNVALLLHNRIEVVEAWFGCQKLRATPMPLNFRVAQPELEYILENSDAVAIISDEPLAGIAAAARRTLDAVCAHLGVGDPPDGAEDYEAALAAASPEQPASAACEDDIAFLMYTSGTTGRPKGAMLSQQNLVANTVNWIHEIGAHHEDVWLSGLPLFHIGGVNGILPFLYLGTTAVITRSTGFDAGESVRLLERHSVTMCYFVLTQWLDICRHPEREHVDTGRLRRALWGASPAPRSKLELLVTTFPAVEIVNAFGQTEMSSNTTFLRGGDAVRKMGSIGKPAINVEVRVVDDDGNDVARGEVGEIVYRGPTVMQGYYGDAAATEEAFAGGWFHSGDLVYADDDGFLFVVDRKKDMIISGGENIYPAEVERVLEEHPDVNEAAVVAVKHPRWVETPVAVVVASAGSEPSEPELIEHCKRRLASYKKPSAVVVVNELPRNAAGKVLKRELRERYGAMFA
jgi:acyl-CoA synthetase (AMP-forming)/AMP-acid ligase II